jgi:ATP-dependent Clp protease adaptor protein ClpS
MSGWSLEEYVKQNLSTNTCLPALRLPKRFKIILLNDDYTPMDFVIDTLKRFFKLNDELAASVMWQVHINGRGICGVYTRDIAETKVAQVNDFAQGNQHPLLCMMEPD